MTTTSPSPSAQPARFDGPLADAFSPELIDHALDALGATPDMGVPTARDRDAWLHAHPTTVEAIRDTARLERGTPWPQPLASQYARYFRDGNRTEYEDAVGERQRRLTRATVMAAVTAETAWIDEVADGIQLICEQSSWSWAAHDDTNARWGRVVPTASAPYLDLGAGEVVGQLVWIDHVLGSLLDERAPGITERMRHETELRVIDPFLTRRDWWWLGLDGDVNNWNPWIHGNVILAALRLVPDPRRRTEVLASAIEGLDRFLASLPADGAIDEGFSYWWNGAGRALEALDTLRIATSGVLDATSVSVVREVLRFPHRMQLGADWYVNVADGPAKAATGLPWHVPFRWGTIIGDADVVAHAVAHRDPSAPVASERSGLGRLVRALFDRDWAEATPGDPPAQADPQARADPSAPTWLPAHVWLPSTGMLVARERGGDSAGLAFAAKGGHNAEHHNHKDLGSYIVALDGVPVLVDAGQPTYTAQTFGPDRYGIRAMQSAWHTTVAPWGLEQGEGRRFAATGLRMTGGADTDEERLELALERAYPLEEGGSWRRSVALLRHDARVVVDDAWDLPPHATEATGTEPAETQPADTAQAAHGILIHHLIHGRVSLDAESNVAEVTDETGERMLRLAWQGPQPVTASLTEWRLDDPLLTAVWGPVLRRLTLCVDAEPAHGASGALTVTIERLR